VISLRKLIYLFIIVVLAGALFIGLDNAGLFSLTEKDTLVIGFPVALTGKLASFGEASRNGADIALNEINLQNGKYKLSIVYDDTKMDNAYATSTVTKMVNIDNIKLIIGAGSSAEVLSIAPITEKNKVLLMVPTASADEISNAGDFVFRTRDTAKLNSYKLAEYLIKKNVNEITVFSANTPNSLSYSKEFKSRYEQLGGKVKSYFEYLSSEQDFKTEIAKADLKNDDVVYIAGATGIDSGLLVKQLSESSYNGKIFGTLSFDSKEFLEISKKIDNEIIITSPVIDSSNPKTANFILSYKSKYGTDPNTFAVNAYDSVYLLYDAAVDCGGQENTTCIRDYLYNVKDYNGAEGQISFDPNGDVIKEIGLKTLKEGKFIPIS